MRILMSVTKSEGLRIQSDLAAAGYPVTVADDGMGLFEQLDILRFPVVLLETAVPDLRWQVALQQLRTQCPGMSILVIDNAGSRADRMQALDLGADDILEREMPGVEIAARILAVASRRADAACRAFQGQPA